MAVVKGEVSFRPRTSLECGVCYVKSLWSFSRILRDDFLKELLVAVPALMRYTGR